MSPVALLALLSLHTPAEPCPRDVVESFDRLDNALRHLADEIDEGRGKPEHKEHLREDLTDAMVRSQQARAVACREARPTTTVVVEPKPAILDDDAARSLAAAVRKEPFDEGRLAVLTSGVQGACVTASQARDLAAELTFSHPRLEAVRAMAPRIVDRADAWRVFEDFTFDSDKRAAKEIFSSTTQLPECGVAQL
jgi:hypothetical protein